MFKRKSRKGFLGEGGRPLQPLWVGLLAAFFLAALNPAAFGSQGLMKGPPQEQAHRTGAARNLETSAVSLAFLGAIGFYQKRISSIGGPDRCGFRPGCSTYGVMALKEQGPLIGLMMIGDRQIRFHIWKKSGPDYTLLPNGKLFDPPSKNLVFD